jgi:hypothetical protein
MTGVVSIITGYGAICNALAGSSTAWQAASPSTVGQDSGRLDEHGRPALSGHNPVELIPVLVRPTGRTEDGSEKLRQRCHVETGGRVVGPGDARWSLDGGRADLLNEVESTGHDASA